MTSEALKRLLEKKSLVNEAIKENGIAKFYCPSCQKVWKTRWKEGIEHNCCS